MWFDFHHHAPNKYGLYHLNLGEIPKEHQIYSVGLHPKDVDLLTEKDWDWFYHHSQSTQCWAIGECGLDALVSAPEPLQNEVFERQILWANELQKPVIIHCVRRFSQILRGKNLAKTPMIVHGFNKNQNIANDLLKKGFYLSFGRAVLFNFHLQEVVKNTPLDQLFLETDAQEFNIEDLYQKVSALRGISVLELKEIVEKNLKRIF